MSRPSFKSSVETRLIIQEFEKATVGSIVTYERMEEVASKPRGDLRGSIHTALKRVLRDRDMVFAAVRKVGFKRLDDIEIVDKGSSDASAIRRRAMRAIEQQMKVDFSKLPHSKQMQSSAQTSILGAVSMMTKPATVQKIAGKIDGNQKELPTTQTLSLFMKG